MNARATHSESLRRIRSILRAEGALKKKATAFDNLEDESPGLRHKGEYVKRGQLYLVWYSSCDDVVITVTSAPPDLTEEQDLERNDDGEDNIMIALENSGKFGIQDSKRKDFLPLFTKTPPDENRKKTFEEWVKLLAMAFMNHPLT